MVLPYILRFNADLDHARGNYNVAAKKYQRLAKILDLPCSSVTVGFSQFVKTVEKLNKSLKIPSTIKKGGYDMKLFKQCQEEIIEAALADVTTTTNPRKPTYVDIERLLKQIGG
jgi:alcohol dehydrogenase class IV